MRVALFFIVFVVAIALSAPLDRWILPRIQGPLAAAGADLRVGSLRFALPAGLRANDVGLEARGGGVSIDSFYVGLTRNFEAEACGGRIRGRVSRDSVDLDLSGVDPSACLRVGKLELESTLDGKLSIENFDLLNPQPTPETVARIDVTSANGFFRGILEKAASGGQDLPLGEWEFSDLVLRADYSDGKLSVKEGHAMTNGVEWELLGANLPSSDSKGGFRVDFRARQVEDDPRSRALIGLMPKSPADSTGWHNYKVTGSLKSPRVVAAN